MKLTINTNDEVYFKPTKQAQKAYEDYFKNLGFNLSLNIDEEGYAHIHLWEFMNLFGPAYRLGHEVPTEGNVIEFRG